MEIQICRHDKLPGVVLPRNDFLFTNVKLCQFLLNFSNVHFNFRRDFAIFNCCNCFFFCKILLIILYIIDWFMGRTPIGCTNCILTTTIHSHRSSNLHHVHRPRDYTSSGLNRRQLIERHLFNWQGWQVHRRALALILATWLGVTYLSRSN